MSDLFPYILVSDLCPGLSKYENMYEILPLDGSDEAEQEDEEDERAEEDDEMSCPDTSIQELAARATAEVATATGKQRRQKVSRHTKNYMPWKWNMLVCPFIWPRLARLVCQND